MPSVNGVPVGPRRPPWNDLDPNTSAVEFRGFPAPLGWWQRKPSIPTPMQNSPPDFTVARNFSRGADAFTPVFGIVPINPIGAGIPSTFRPQTITGPGSRYVAGAIWWTPQTMSTSTEMNKVTPFNQVNTGIRDVVGAYFVG